MSSTPSTILVVGSVAFDTLETPHGRAERVLGGSASFFSVAASFFVPVRLVAVIGDDFGEKELRAFRGRPIDLEGLERAAGRTFHWQGRYSADLNSRESLCTDLNVFEFFEPRIPASYRTSEHVFLGNIDPVLQRRVLDQVERPRVVACDTMNFWIAGKPAELRRTLERVDVLLVNDAEARELSGEWNVVRAARVIQDMGPKTVVVKKGEHGVLLFTAEGAFAAPAYPLGHVVDPTGAGDTFAGGFMGYLASRADTSEANLRRAVVAGSALASYCVEAFGLDRLLTLTRPEIEDRYRRFQDLTQFEAI
jgi:sugar/nucleoside kinase (ribokinase family)